MTFAEAIKGGDLTQVKAFIADGVDVEERLCEGGSNDGFTPLEAAAGAGHPEVVNALLEAGASPHKGSFTPLYFAVENDDLNLLITLLEGPRSPRRPP